MVGDGGKQWKTMEKSGRGRRMAGDGGGRWGIVLHSEVWVKFQKRPGGRTACCPSVVWILTCQATLENDQGGRRAVVRLRVGSGRMDGPVENTDGNDVITLRQWSGWLK